MKILPKPIAFNWDEGNIDKNLIRHDVTNKEAEEIFGNNPLKIFPDLKHLEKEQRFVAYGVTNQNRKLAIVFTLRRGQIRVISARVQNRKERGIYEEET